jgi:hypothetical protein
MLHHFLVSPDELLHRTATARSIVVGNNHLKVTDGLPLDGTQGFDQEIRSAPGGHAETNPESVGIFRLHGFGIAFRLVFQIGLTTARRNLIAPQIRVGPMCDVLA